MKIQSQNGTVNTFAAKDCQYIRNNMNYSPKIVKFDPKLPTNIRETQKLLTSIESKTSRGENFLTVNDIEIQIVIFSCAIFSVSFIGGEKFKINLKHLKLESGFVTLPD